MREQQSSRLIAQVNRHSRNSPLRSCLQLWRKASSGNSVHPHERDRSKPFLCRPYSYARIALLTRRMSSSGSTPTASATSSNSRTLSCRSPASNFHTNESERRSFAANALCVRPAFSLASTRVTMSARCLALRRCVFKAALALPPFWTRASKPIGSLPPFWSHR